jgi:Amt family ammonium transporter
LYGGGVAVLKAQVIGSLIITVATFAVALAVMYLIKAVGLLRVSAEGETYGLDLHEHGISAYPEYVISAMGRPDGMVHREMDKSGKEITAHLSPIEPTA